MPKHNRPGYQRVEVYLPPAVGDAITAKAGGSGRRNAWIVAALAKAAGVRVGEQRGRGRPKKDAPA